MNTMQVHVAEATTELTEAAMRRLAQAYRTVETLNDAVIEPFDAFALESGAKRLYDADGLVIKVTERSRTERLSAKNVVDTLQMTLQIALAHQAAGKQMYGVRDFDGTVAIDASYLKEQFAHWRNTVLGTSMSRFVEYKGEAVDAIVAEHTGRLLLDDGLVLRLDAVPVDEMDATLYVAASAQAKRVQKSVIQPLEKRLKERAYAVDGHTTFDRMDYDDVSVQVKSVGRAEPEYKTIVDSLARHLGRFARQGPRVTEGVTFYNTDLNEPRTYVGVEKLLEIIASERAVTQPKMRQERPVLLYRPDPAILLVA